VIECSFNLVAKFSDDFIAVTKLDNTPLDAS